VSDPTSYPGVYVKEITSTSSVVYSNETTVPIIALEGWPTGAAQKLNSYADFLSHDDTNGDDDIDLHAYFECGGGPCYVVSYKDFLTEVPKYDDVTLLVNARQHDMNSDVAALCQSGTGLFALLDRPATEITDGTAADDYPETPFAATYYPWLDAPWSSGNIPAAIVMAGMYCMSDRTRGIWKAPANIALPASYTPQYIVTDDLQGKYNTGKAINMIRQINNRGLLVWGARTLEDSDDWRYISVRRLFNRAERDIKTAMRSMVFEPNNQPTWEKVRSAINNYLYGLWRQGALVGATEQQAYFVKIGEGITMSADDIAQGQMIAQVGMAATRPAEFIILQFTQDVVPA